MDANDEIIFQNVSPEAKLNERKMLFFYPQTSKMLKVLSECMVKYSLLTGVHLESWKICFLPSSLFCNLLTHKLINLKFHSSQRSSTIVILDHVQRTLFLKTMKITEKLPKLYLK